MTSQRESPDPIEIFISYSHDDEALRKELQNHLSALKLNGRIIEWYDRMIAGGEDWEEKISEHLESANIILLLVSSSFLASDYCTGKEMRRALERHHAKEATVIPVIVRTVDWTGTELGGLQALPTDAKAVTAWADRDQALTDIAKGIARVVTKLSANP